MIVVGIDMAFANMGLARARLDDNAPILCLDLKLVSTVSVDTKVVRKSSNELRRAAELVAELRAFCAGADFAIAEVPSGSQSAGAARALGIAVGVLASCPIPIIEVSQREVKLASIGTTTASKTEIIQWAVGQWPTAPWLRVKRKGAMQLTASNEHLADAMATIKAGLASSEYQKLRAMRNGTTSTPVQRPAPDIEPQGCVPSGDLLLARGRVRLT